MSIFIRGGLLIALAASCAPSNAGRTVGDGVLQLEGGVGGPMVTNLGGAIPVPNAPLGVRYGLRDNVDLSAHINLLPIVLGGFMALDASLTYGVFQHQENGGFNLATGMGFIALTDFQEGFRASPVFDVAGSYTMDWFTPYVGTILAMDLWAGRQIINPQIGMEADLGRWTVQLSGTWYHLGYDWSNSAVRYVSPRKSGGLGTMLGLKYGFCGLRKKGMEQ